MKHLDNVNDDAISFIKNVVDSTKLKKNDKNIIKEREKCIEQGLPLSDEKTYKERCQIIIEKNKNEIIKYDEKFNADELFLVEKGIPHPFNEVQDDSKDLLGLYSYNAKIIKDLRNRVLNKTDSFCPICGINKVNSMDHYIPKTENPLYVVHPRNLIPCCTVCNGHKLENVFFDDNSRKYWNAYIDIEPDQQYLFCDVSEKNGLPVVSFRIQQGTIPHDIFKIIYCTFNDMKLNENYSEVSRKIISKLINSACNFYIRFDGTKSLDECISLVETSISYENNINEWEYVLQKSLVVTDVYKNNVINQLQNVYQIF